MVVAGEVEEAVENENFEFGDEGMILFGGLTVRDGKTDGEIAGDFVFELWVSECRERKNVGGFVVAAEAAIECALIGIGGEEDVDFAAEADDGLGLGEEASQ